MSRVAGIAFTVLVVATFGAFFVAQRLKGSPAVVGEFRRTPFFSPNSDGRFDRATVRFEIRKRDRVTLAVVDADGDEVRELIAERTVLPYREVRARWDGRDDDGGMVRDGTYRYRITLPNQGRNVVIPESVRLDTTAPRPRVTAIGPVRDKAPRPELLPAPGGGEAVVHLDAPGRKKKILLFKTSPGPLRQVGDPIPLLDDATEWRWAGRTESGRPVSPGTYLVAVQARDQAGNIGTSPPLDRRGLPATTYGSPLPGRGGISVRYLAVQPPVRPVRAGQPVTFGVDARGERWRWSVRRVGSNQVIRRSTDGRTRGGVFRLTAPGRESGVYLLEVRTRTRHVTVPFAVQGAERRPVLVVLPTMTWQGRNPVDDDGDGLPNVLDRGLPARLGRVLAGDGLPAGFAARDAPLLAWLARTGRRFDVTTDVALAARGGPRIDGHAGVLLPSDVRWLPSAVQQRLRRFVRRGGTLLSLGVDSLRRSVRVSPRGRLLDATPAAPTDLFGGRLGPLRRAPAPVALTEASDGIELFTGTNGEFPGWRLLEPLAGAGREGRLVASALTEADRAPITAVRFGRGLVLRYGLPEFAGRLTLDETDPQTALMARTWTLLSR
ncbi:MAG TPA: N,N-dimethylformamidase beta subunit family domain-containing protein [Solirubrobacteraceae bacterium]|nr:N,N-dimethylformamidase beta subunit family domain-containing protein [Solirubrobacteraceae bacterium]